MEITKEQFDKIGPWYCDDFPVDDSNQELMFEIFKMLPFSIQGIAIQWGCSDTVFRDEAFTYLCKKFFDVSPQEFYDEGLNNLSCDYIKNEGVTK